MREKGVKDDTKIFGLSNWKKKLLSMELGEAMKGKINILILDMFYLGSQSEIQVNLLIYLDIQVWSSRQILAADINLWSLEIDNINSYEAEITKALSVHKEQRTKNWIPILRTGVK